LDTMRTMVQWVVITTVPVIITWVAWSEEIIIMCTMLLGITSVLIVISSHHHLHSDC